MLSPEVLGILKCPNCDSSRLAHEVIRDEGATDIVDGVVWCEKCRLWYPIEDRLLDFMIGALAYDHDLAGFWATHKDRLTNLGLAPRSSIGSDERKLQKIQQDHFDWWAKENSQSYLEYEETSFWQAADSIAFEPWKREIAERSRLLDVGCAQGRSTFKFMDCDLDIVGIDISKALIRQAITRYRKGEYRARAAFIAADASRFPLQDESVDTVLVYGVLHHLPDPATTCKEISRVLKTNGSYIGQENNETVFRALFDLLQRLRPQWQEEAGPEAIISGERLRGWFSDTPVEITTKTSVFLPPHLCNLMSLKMSRRMLTATDRIGGAIPYLRDQGGVILIHGRKSVGRGTGASRADYPESE